MRQLVKIVAISTSERVWKTTMRCGSELLAVHLLKRLLGPFCRFSARRWYLCFCSSSSLRYFYSSIFRRSGSISPTVRCSAGASDGNEVHFRTETLADRMFLTVSCFLMIFITLCTIREVFVTFFRKIENVISSVFVKLTHANTSYPWDIFRGARATIAMCTSI